MDAIGDLRRIERRNRAVEEGSRQRLRSFLSDVHDALNRTPAVTSRAERSSESEGICDMGRLGSGTVQDIVKAVLFKADELVDGQAPEGAIKVEGLVNNFTFHPERIAQAKPEIDALLAELPDNFHRGKGGGWTFLNACQDRDGEQWTGLHQAMEQLVCLGIAAGSASWMMRDIADVLPGGVPYFEVHPEAANATAR